MSKKHDNYPRYSGWGRLFDPTTPGVRVGWDEDPYASREEILATRRQRRLDAEAQASGEEKSSVNDDESENASSPTRSNEPKTVIGQNKSSSKGKVKKASLPIQHTDTETVSGQTKSGSKDTSQAKNTSPRLEVIDTGTVMTNPAESHHINIDSDHSDTQNVVSDPNKNRPHETDNNRKRPLSPQKNATKSNKIPRVDAQKVPSPQASNNLLTPPKSGNPPRFISRIVQPSLNTSPIVSGRRLGRVSSADNNSETIEEANEHDTARRPANSDHEYSSSPDAQVVSSIVPPSSPLTSPKLLPEPGSTPSPPDSPAPATATDHFRTPYGARPWSGHYRTKVNNIFRLDGESDLSFAKRLQPSKLDLLSRECIEYVFEARQVENFTLVFGAMCRWYRNTGRRVVSLQNDKRTTLRSTVFKEAQEAGITGGRWVIVCKPSEFDAAWAKAVECTARGRLGRSVTAVPRPRNRHIVYSAQGFEFHPQIFINTFDMFDTVESGSVLANLQFSGLLDYHQMVHIDYETNAFDILDCMIPDGVLLTTHYLSVMLKDPLPREPRFEPGVHPIFRHK